MTSDEILAISARQAANVISDSRQAIDNRQYPCIISLRLSENLFEGGTGCHDWEAGFLLAEFIMSNPNICKGEIPATTCMIKVSLMLMDSVHNLGSLTYKSSESSMLQQGTI